MLAMWNKSRHHISNHPDKLRFESSCGITIHYLSPYMTQIHRGKVRVNLVNLKSAIHVICSATYDSAI
jgi:hypothetical protein